MILLDEYVRTVPVDLTDFNRRNEESDTKSGWYEAAAAAMIILFGIITIITTPALIVHTNRYHAWNKLLAWTLTEYEKLVLIDSDAVAWNNADELFLYPEFAAVQDSVWPIMSHEYTQYFNTGMSSV